MEALPIPPPENVLFFLGAMALVIWATRHDDKNHKNR